ncbi:uncharacterized protein EI90DRAFT_3064489, partial [Cantharellus anzutake]|uniref:uncharacterized protein n=1 Tax=Cantharellus anzutake TaxID=1750568 RepID=UPI0019050344
VYFMILALLCVFVLTNRFPMEAKIRVPRFNRTVNQSSELGSLSWVLRTGLNRTTEPRFGTGPLSWGYCKRVRTEPNRRTIEGLIAP